MKSERKRDSNATSTSTLNGFENAKANTLQHPNSNPQGWIQESSAVMWGGHDLQDRELRSNSPKNIGHSFVGVTLTDAQQRAVDSALRARSMVQGHQVSAAHFSTAKSTNGNSSQPQTDVQGIAANVRHLANVADFDVIKAREVAHKIIKDARSRLTQTQEGRKRRKDTAPSSRTLQNYAEKCRIVDQKIAYVTEPSATPLEHVMAGYAHKKQTYHAMLSALKWRATENLSTLLMKQDKLQRARGNEIAWLICVLDLRSATQKLDEINALDHAALLEYSGKTPVKSRSKKQVLHLLPANWRAQFDVANASSVLYADAGVLLQHCGVRPIELEHGVVVRREGAQLIVRIVGGKVREGIAGQAWREMRLLCDTLPVWFVQRVSVRSQITIRAKAHNLRSHLGRISQKLFPRTGTCKKLEPLLSAYVFRHALVTDLRSNDWDENHIAAVLGETTADTSLKWYGLKKRTVSAKTAPISIVKGSVKTAMPVRPADTAGLVELLAKRQVSLPRNQKKNKD